MYNIVMKLKNMKYIFIITILTIAITLTNVLSVFAANYVHPVQEYLKEFNYEPLNEFDNEVYKFLAEHYTEYDYIFYDNDTSQIVGMRQTSTFLGGSILSDHCDVISPPKDIVENTPHSILPNHVLTMYDKNTPDNIYGIKLQQIYDYYNPVDDPEPPIDDPEPSYDDINKNLNDIKNIVLYIGAFMLLITLYNKVVN